MQIPSFTRDDKAAENAAVFALFTLPIIPWSMAAPISIHLFNKTPSIYTFPLVSCIASFMSVVASIAAIAVCGAFYRVCIDPFKIFFSSTTQISIISAFTLAGEAHKIRFANSGRIYEDALSIMFDVLAGPTRMLINGMLALDSKTALKGAALVGVQVLGYVALNYALPEFKMEEDKYNLRSRL